MENTCKNIRCEMVNKTVPMTLVSSASQSLCRPLYDTLMSLGYKDIELLDCNEFLNTDFRQTRILVVPLNWHQKSQFHDNIDTVCKRIHHEPVLGIISNSTDLLNKEALTFCNEFLSWPCAEREIGLRIERLTKLLQSKFQLDSEREVLDEFLTLNMIGRSPSFLHVLQQIKKLARYEASVLIEGESGTGKELAAQAIHSLSERRGYPFIPVNCGAIPDSLLENELFGHSQGAFTDASTSQEGLICQAEGGTLFLDEVEIFSPKGQVMLLRFLQDQQYRSLGSNKYTQANVRIIAASNVKLRELVRQGGFRLDLYYRLYIMWIEMPPLSKRGNDILLLANYFINKFRIKYKQPEKQLDRASIKWLMEFSWPGNVRELENLLHREFLMATGKNISFGEEPNVQKDRRRTLFDRRHKALLSERFNESKARIISQFEINYLTHLIGKSNGNVTRAAKRAGMERRSLGKLLKKHSIEKPETH